MARPHPDCKALVEIEKEFTVASRSSRRKPCMLIVDDDSDIWESMCDAITSWH